MKPTNSANRCTRNSCTHCSASLTPCVYIKVMWDILTSLFCITYTLSVLSNGLNFELTDFSRGTSGAIYHLSLYNLQMQCVHKIYLIKPLMFVMWGSRSTSNNSDEVIYVLTNGHTHRQTHSNSGLAKMKTVVYLIIDQRYVH